MGEHPALFAKQIALEAALARAWRKACKRGELAGSSLRSAKAEHKDRAPH